jgi:hypothetical protein
MVPGNGTDALEADPEKLDQVARLLSEVAGDGTALQLER